MSASWTQRNDGIVAVTGRDAAGAGALLLAVNALSTAAGAVIGSLVGATVPLALAGFGIGFFLGIAVVITRFRNL